MIKNQLKLSWWLKSLTKRFLRFASVGVFCLGFNWTVNYVMLVYYNTRLVPTYVVVYLFSILLSFFLNSHFTYASKKTVKNLINYSIIYLSAMFIGVLLLQVYEFLFDFEKWIYPMMVTPITMCWNFFNSSWVLKNK